jgi:predicted dehydrogenase
MTKPISRRQFVKSTAAGLAIPFAAPAILSARSPNETVRVAGVGVGGKGWSDIVGASNHADVVAYCDVVSGGKSKRRGGYGAAAEKWTKATGYSDFRKLIEKEHKNLDAITVSTPDHMHAPVTMMAMQHGLAVYTQKPLTRTVSEARALTNTAKKTKVATQMGNQGHSSGAYRTLVNAVQSGVIGKVKAVHTWSNRPIWPQGIQRPAGSDPVPDGLDWDLWLGVAKQRPFKSEVYHPFKWRGWYDFGAGALGDMGCHIIDPAVWSLDLGPALSVAYYGPTPMKETFPTWEILTYRFAGTKYTTDEIKLVWYDGGKFPKIAGSHLTSAEQLPKQGILLIGEKGSLVSAHGKFPQLYTDDGLTDLPTPAATDSDHYEMWVNGIKSGKEANSGFSYSGPLTETVLLGVIASRVGLGELKWDSKNLRFPDSKLATSYVHDDYRDGWEFKGLS